MSIEWVMPSNHLNLCHPLLLLPSIFSSIRVFSTESVLRIRWPGIIASASASVLPMNIQCLFPLGLTGLLSLQSKGLSNESSPTPQFKSINSSVLSFLYGPPLTSIHDYWKTIAWTRWTFVGKVTSRLVIAFLARSKHLSVSWLQSPSVMVILEPPKIKSLTVSTVSPSI